MTQGKSLSFDREAVLLEALELFWQNGYEATGVAELLDHMGIQRQSFYNQFHSKKGIFIEALELYFQMLFSRVSGTVESPSDPVQKAYRILDLWEDLSVQGRGKGCLACNSLGEGLAKVPEIGELITTKMEEVESLFAEVFGQIHAQGRLPKGMTPRGLARTFHSSFQGLASVARMANAEEKIQDVTKTLRCLVRQME